MNGEQAVGARTVQPMRWPFCDSRLERDYAGHHGRGKHRRRNMLEDLFDLG